MARPKLPKNVHILKGTAKQHPERMRERENEPENVNPLGSPPRGLSANEKRYWKQIESDCIPGVLGEADRLAVTVCAKILAKVFENEATAAEYGQAIKLLGQMGMTPSERSKINLPKPKEKNPFDD